MKVTEVCVATQSCLNEWVEGRAENTALRDAGVGSAYVDCLESEGQGFHDASL